MGEKITIPTAAAAKIASQNGIYYGQNNGLSPAEQNSTDILLSSSSTNGLGHALVINKLDVRNTLIPHLMSSLQIGHDPLIISLESQRPSHSSHEHALQIIGEMV